MIRLPREFMWTDVESMESFLQDPLNRELYNVYKEVKDAPFKIRMSDEKVFNELYYLCVSLKFGNITIDELDSVILADLGFSYAPGLLSSMVYAVFILQDRFTRPEFVYGLYSRLNQNKSWYYETFNNFASNHKESYKTDFSPKPESAIKAINRVKNWEDLTFNYGREDIIRILRIWKRKEDKLLILDSITEAFKSHHRDDAGTFSSNGVSHYFPIEIGDLQMLRDRILKYKELTSPVSFQNKDPQLTSCVVKDNEIARVEKNSTETRDNEITILKYPFVVKIELIDDIINKMHSFLRGKSSPKDKMMPIRAAQDAGVIRRPTYSEIKKAFGEEFISNSSYHNYTDPGKKPFVDNNIFDLMVNEFKKLID